ncbi:MAG: helix-turn-helix transcriptional regulator [Ruminococcus sp.]|nr:helix-turn-helix transcriptional regulator [Ruminococcus sp.]
MNVLNIGYNSVYGSDFSAQSAPQEGVIFLILVRSRARLTVGGASVRVPADTMMICGGLATRGYAADGCPLVCDWVSVDVSDEPELTEMLSPLSERPVPCPDTGFVSTMIRTAAEEFYSLGARRGKMLDSLMRTLLVRLSESSRRREIPVQTADPHYSALFELREKIYRNPQLKWNVDTMAADVNMSRSYFQHVYREVFGVSCISDVISGKLEKAKELLTETGCTVAQVAAMCGYDNEEHFMRQFKKIVGVTPTKYRKG